jgi:hypothetical protein
MRAQRTIARKITAAIACLAILSAALPAAAAASSLLSGYGGPGEGSQAILGSSLVGGENSGGGPGTGAGGGPSGGAASRAASESSTAGARTGETGTAAHGSPQGVGAGQRSAGAITRGGALAPSGSSRGGQGKIGKAPAPAAGASSVGSPRMAGRTVAVASEPLGLRAEYLLYLLLAVVVLIFAGVLTKRLARTGATGERG